MVVRPSFVLLIFLIWHKLTVLLSPTGCAIVGIFAKQNPTKIYFYTTGILSVYCGCCWWQLWRRNVQWDHVYNMSDIFLYVFGHLLWFWSKPLSHDAQTTDTNSWGRTVAAAERMKGDSSATSMRNNQVTERIQFWDWPAPGTLKPPDVTVSPLWDDSVGLERSQTCYQIIRQKKIITQKYN